MLFQWLLNLSIIIAVLLLAYELITTGTIKFKNYEDDANEPLTPGKAIFIGLIWLGVGIGFIWQYFNPSKEDAPNTLAPTASNGNLLLAQPNAPSACPLSTDWLYAYNESQPVHVGGGAANGQAHAEAFLNNLRTTDGATLHYEWRGYILKNNSTLDMVEVRGGPVLYQMYFDYETVQPVLAPIGFICAQPLTWNTP